MGTDEEIKQCVKLQQSTEQSIESCRNKTYTAESTLDTNRQGLSLPPPPPIKHKWRK